MAGMDHKYCSEAAHQGHFHPCRGAKTVPHGPDCAADHQGFFCCLLDMVVNAMPLLCRFAGRQNPCRGAVAVSHGLPDIDTLQLLDTVIDVPVVQVVQLPGSFTRRGAEADSHGPDCSSDHRFPSSSSTK